MNVMLSKKNCLTFVFFFVVLSLFAGKRDIIFSARMAEDKTLTKEKIMVLFRDKAVTYLENASEYLCDFTVYSGKDKQNYAWALAVVKDSFKDGTVYEIWFSFSNGVFVLRAGDTHFNSKPLGTDEGDNDIFDSAPIDASTATQINKDLEACMDLACEAYVQNGLPMDSEKDLPMDCYKFE